MKNIISIITLLSIIAFTALTYAEGAYELTEEFVVADFNTGEKPNNIDGTFGTFDYDPHDETQWCLMEFSEFDVHATEGMHSVKIIYDVQSPNPAFNGFWMKLEGVDITKYNRLRFWVRGDSEVNYTSRFKVELKNDLGERAIYFVKGVTSQWREIIIAFKDTKAITDWTTMTEFTVVFTDLVSTYREGVIYIDDIAFLLVAEEENVVVE